MKFKENECLNCDFFDEDFGCTIASIDKCYACSIENKTNKNK